MIEEVAGATHPTRPHGSGASRPGFREPAGGQRGVLEAALRWHAHARSFALILVVETEGSTYRKPGAMAAVASDGERVGVISGGCLESALDSLAEEALEAGEPCLTTFDTRSDEDRLLGSGSGCRGLMHVLGLPVPAGRPCRTLEVLRGAFADGRASTLRLAELAPALFTTGEVRIAAPPRGLLLGGGPEAPPLLRLMRTLGWYSCVADHRRGLLTPERMLHADRLVEGRPAAALAELTGTSVDAALVMTHVASTDLEALQALSVRPPQYVGLIGPPARRDELLAQLEPAESETLTPCLRSPVGLDLGGDGPEAIALAVVAELQRELHR